MQLQDARRCGSHVASGGRGNGGEKDGGVGGQTCIRAPVYVLTEMKCCVYRVSHRRTMLSRPAVRT